MRRVSFFSRPDFYDCFGFIAFCFIIVIALWILLFKETPPVGMTVVLLGIGIVGAVVDGYFMHRFFTNQSK